MSGGIGCVVLPLAALAISAGAAFLLVRGWRDSCKQLRCEIAELEASLETSLQQRAAERKGRIRAQQELRKALVGKDLSNGDVAVYPMTPIGIIQSCFSTRNGTPRQPLLVPLARACLALMPGGVPPTALDGLAEYSHCWLLYVFHANTDLPHLWKQPSHRDFKAKVRVPRLDGGKLGVYATRSPHRPCPIGLTVAKVEGVHGRMLLLSGIDLVDGTPVLDVKPYLPYCDSVQGAQAPCWVTDDNALDPLALASVEFTTGFVDDLSNCWEIMGRRSMYSDADEFKKLVEQVLARDIRSLRQRQKPHNSNLRTLDEETSSAAHGQECPAEGEVIEDGDVIIKTKAIDTIYADAGSESRQISIDYEKGEIDPSNGNSDIVVYHLILEGINIAYTINCGQVLVQGAEVSLSTKTAAVCDCNYGIWA